MKRTRLVLRILLVTALFISSIYAPVGADQIGSLSPSDDGYYYHIVSSDQETYVVIDAYAHVDSVQEIVVPAMIEGVPVRHVAALGYGTTVERVVIPEGVYAISSAYAGPNVKEILFPSTLKIIGGSLCCTQFGFASIPALKELTIPPSVGLIMKEPFPEDLVLRVEAGSYAHRWAKANGQPFEIIQHDPSIGDYDADGLTTSTDARLLLQQVAGKVDFTDEQFAVADVDGDGKVTTTDARLTLQYAVGKEAVDTLTCPLTFNIPFIPREKVLGVTGSIIETCPPEEDTVLDDGMFPGYNYSREYGPVKNPLKMVDYLNERIGKEYKSRYLEQYKVPTSGASVNVKIEGEDSFYMNKGRIDYYGITISLSLDEQFSEIINE